MIAQRIFRRRVRLKYLCNPRFLGDRSNGELKWRVLAEDVRIKAHDKDALTVLRHPSSRIDYVDEQLIFEPFQPVFDHLPGAPAIVGPKVLDVLEQDNRRTLELDDVCKGEEQVSLLRILEAVCFP